MKINFMKSSAISLYLILTIVGCSNQPTPVENLPKLTTQQALSIEKIDTHFKEWEKIKPDLYRLVAIENELKELILELNGIVEKSDANNNQLNTSNIAPVINSKAIEAPSSILVSPIKKITDSTINDQQLSESNEKLYAIQLYSVSNKELLTSLWMELLDKHHSIFKDLSPSFQEIKVNEKQFYRLKAGRFSTKEEAKKLCDELYAVDVKCYISLGIGKQFL